MTAELERNEAGEIQLVLIPHCTTIEVALEDHAAALGFVFDAERGAYILTPSKASPSR